MRLIKFFVGFVVAAALLFFFVANFSAEESRFQCPGDLSSKSGLHHVTAYAKLQEYRWWVHLWSESDGNLWLEIPNESVEYYSPLVKNGDKPHIYDSAKAFKGMFSGLSKTLALSTPVGFFDGTCKRIDR